MLKIIISPAKKMNIIDEYPCTVTKPAFSKEAKYLHGILTKMSRDELKKLWRCSDKLTDTNYDRLHTHLLEKNHSPSLLAYEGIQYQYMAPQIFSESEWEYVSKYLRILSGFYGILRPTDGVVPYRLEMQAKLETELAADLYQFWGRKLYERLTESRNVRNLQIVNLASAEYSRIILPYITAPATCVTCIFGEEVDGKIKVKGTKAKMARGEMVRWMAEHQIKNISDIRGFDRLNYRFQEETSSDNKYVFLKTV